VVTNGNDPHKSIPATEAKIQIRDNYLKPEVPENTNSTLQLLLKQCWYNDPDVRPSASDIIEIIQDVS
jgi:hypothetical protein